MDVVLDVVLLVNDVQHDVAQTRLSRMKRHGGQTIVNDQFQLLVEFAAVDGVVPHVDHQTQSLMCTSAQRSVRVFKLHRSDRSWNHLVVEGVQVNRHLPFACHHHSPSNPFDLGLGVEAKVFSMYFSIRLSP